MKVRFSERETQSLPLHVRTLLKQVASAAGRLQKMHKNCEVSISIVTAEEIQELNASYRNKDIPTDVLSFPAMDGDGAGCCIGDIAICLQVATNQAAEYGHSLERELAFLTAHGFLHLVGYDHQTPQDEAEMIAWQKRIMDWVGMTICH